MVDMDNYYGKYVVGLPTSSEEAAKLMNADNVIGDIYKIKCEMKDGQHRAVVINRFGDSPCYFKPTLSRELALNEAKGFITYAILTIVGFTTSDTGENYWAEFALISYPKFNQETFSIFIKEVSKAIKSDKRVEVDLTKDQLDLVIKNNGHFVPTTIHPKPKKKRGQVILKSRVKLTDKMVEQGRKKNPGCYVLGWVFLLAVVALFVLLVKTIFNL